MKVLIATAETQGKRANDFCCTNDGELVMFGIECDNGTVDDECGCKRALCGIDSAKATTTFKVVDMDITRDEFAEKIKVFYNERWSIDKPTSEKLAYIQVEELVRLADTFCEKDILEKRGDRLYRREADMGKKTC